MQRRRLLASLTLLALAACSGSSGGTVAPAAGTAASSAAGATPQSIAVSIAIGDQATAARTRSPQFVSSSTNGVQVQVFAHSDTTHATALGTAAVDVSSGSTACGGVTGARTCTVNIPALSGSDDFVFKTFDLAPNGGVFSGTAKQLATGTINQTVFPGQSNIIRVALGGIIASLTASPLVGALGTGGAQTTPLGITAFDAAGNAIVAGTNDPYPIPITVAVAESGGTGHTNVTLNGAGTTGSASVSVLRSGQTVTVQYDGAGTGSYGATITASVAGAAIAVTPVVLKQLFVSTASTLFSSGALFFTAPGQTATFNLSELGFTGTFNALAGSGCTSIATASTPAAGATSSTTITAGSGSGTCTILLSDGTESVPLNVTTLFTAAQINVPATPGPNGTPPPGISLSPASLAFYGIGSQLQQPVVVSEPNFSGSFSINYTLSTCNNIAYLYGSSGNTFTFYPYQVGSCFFVFTDSQTVPNTATLSISVTTTTFGGQ